MIYTELKQGLQQLLQEDISNRTSIQEMRRNVFLNSETTQKKSRELEEKEQMIANLNSNLERKATKLQTKDEKIAELQELLEAEKASFSAYTHQQEEKIQGLNEQIEELNNKLRADSGMWDEINKLTVENNHYAAKIRELILHLDTQNEKEAGLQKELSLKNTQLKNTNAEKERLLHDVEKYTQQDLFSTNEQEKLAGEVQHLQQKVLLLDAQLSEAKVLIQSQNISVFAAEKALVNLKTASNLAFEDLYAEKMQIVEDKATLIAEQAVWEMDKENLLNECDAVKQELELSKKITEEASTASQYAIGRFEQEKADLHAEKQNLEQEFTALRLSNEEVLISASKSAGLFVEEKEQLLTEIKHLKVELEVLSLNASDNSASAQLIENLNKEIEEINFNMELLIEENKTKAEALEFEKSNLLIQIEDLKLQLLESTSAPSDNTNKTEDDAFIDKLFKQMDALTDEKFRLQTEKEEVEEEVGCMEQKVAELLQTIENQQGEIKNLEETNKQIKLAQALVFSSKDKTATKLKINELVREIDKCIALLSV